MPGATALLEEPALDCLTEPRLLVELESRPRVFFENLRELLQPRPLPPLFLRSAPAPFWSDVFVSRELPWFRFLQSGGYHLIALVLLLAFSKFLPSSPSITKSTFDHAQVVYYQPAEYLPPLDTRPAQSAREQQADPEFSRQPIISLPPEADNHAQTIVAPPTIKLNHDVPLPNIVAWNEKPKLPIAPAPVILAASISRIAPPIDNSVVAPPPDAHASRHRNQPEMQTSVVAPPPEVRNSLPKATFQAPQPAVVEPPPSIQNPSTRTLGDLNIGHTSVIAPAPQLALTEQRAVNGGGINHRGSSAIAAGAPQVVAPPPSLASGSSASRRNLIALNARPTVGAPPNPPVGTRNGHFAATPEGHAGASATAGNHGNDTKDGSGAKRKGTNDLPAGLYVGSAATPGKTGPVAGDPVPESSPHNSVNPNLLASARPPRVTSAPEHALQPGNEAKLSEAERTVFGDRKFYSLTLNMPNLNSAGGSWVIRFAELNHESNSASKFSDPNSSGSNSGDSKSAEAKADLSAPAAIRKVDPGYPLQLMRENVAGTVILYAVIHADGTVGNIRILRSVDDRLDHSAGKALAQWQFHPATKNGAPIDVEATFQIPFHPAPKPF